jgi:hypothetical protein
VKRKDALTIIRAEVAEEGRMTQRAMRAYVENRVSRKSFDDACRQGMAIWTRRQQAANLVSSCPTA